MKRIENPEIRNKIFEVLQEDIGVDTATNQPDFCGDIDCYICAFASTCAQSEDIKINWLRRNWQDAAKRAQIYNLIERTIAVDKNDKVMNCKDMPCTKECCKFYGNINSEFACPTATTAWLEEEI